MGKPRPINKKKESLKIVLHIYLESYLDSFSYTQLYFVFNLQNYFYNVRDHIFASSFSLIQRDLDTFHKHFFEAFL